MYTDACKSDKYNASLQLFRYFTVIRHTFTHMTW